MKYVAKFRQRKNKIVDRYRGKTGLAHNRPGRRYGDRGTGAKARINTFNIGIHLRNPYGTATATCNPKAQDRLPMHGNGG
ncbi:MAG: hypothetical protein L6V80_07235 [Bacteroidales bacterium]|nr:MAG: hypothetical protein L6V80_07235 [Bacteroidales bacterium]